MDQPTVLYIMYTTVSVQQTNLLPENASLNDAVLPKSLFRFKFLWLCNHYSIYVYMYWSSNSPVTFKCLQVLAAPFAAAALFIPSSPWCFLMLIPSNVIGEMWIGVTLALVVDLVPGLIKTASVAIYLFVITIIGGNFNLVVDPIKDRLDGRYDWTLFITFPGLYLLSSVLFLVTFFLLRYDLKRKQKREEMARRHLEASPQVL